ncbi:histidinol-phosphatase [Anatilimnocola aggregata]|nr:histidinol-phosphatase [Anatilimnocola aggregata]
MNANSPSAPVSASVPAAELLTEKLQAAVQWAKEAGQLTLTYFQQENYEVERKSDASPVTIADRSAEQLIRGKIAAQYPTDGIVGEEFGISEGTSGWRWILDPIDGTKSFISGVPMYGTMIGLERDGRSWAGVVYIPGLDEGVFAAHGQGCFHFRGAQAPRPTKVSQRKQLSEGLFVTSQADTFRKRDGWQAFEKLQAAAYITRTWGDCYGYLLVATGRAEVMVDPMLNVWDAAAVQPIIEEAGGTFTDWQGVPTIHAGEAIATNGLVQAEVLAITRDSPRLPQ